MGNIPYKDALNNTRYLKSTKAGTDLDPDIPAFETSLGATDETAPANDTATSALNGRLQRIAQRITSAIALLPGSLGQKTKANSFAVAIANDQDALPITDNNGSLTVDGTITANLGTIAGVATASNQSTSNASLASIDTRLSTVALASNQTISNTSLTNIDTRLGTSGVASSKTGSTAAQMRAIADLLDGTIDLTSTVTFTIASGANLSDTIDIGAGKTLLAIITPSAFTAADLLFNTHPTTAGSVCQKLLTTGARYRLSNIPVAAAANYRVLDTDFLGDRYIQLASVAVGAATVVNQGSARTLLGLVGFR